MISTDAPFETLSKMHKSYNFDQNKIVEFEQFEIQLTDFLHSGAYIYNGSFVEAKHLVDKLGKIKIEIYSNEHPPAHFHISANGYKASLAIDDCRVLENSGFNSKVIKNIQDWFLYSKDRLIEVWNDTRISNCVEENMSLNEFEKAYLNDYAITLRDSADRDYISARAMYKLEIDDKFFWHAQQSLEKYLKAILLFNEIKVKNQGHDLVKLYNRMIETLKVTNESEVKQYLEEFQMLGLNRYHVNSTFSITYPLIILDKLVYFFRKICKVIQNEKDIEINKTVSFNDKYRKINVFSGYLEKVLENKKEKYTEQRKILVWKNFYFGKQIKKKIKNIKLKSSGGSSLLYRHKDAYILLEDYIQLSKEEKNFYNRHHNLDSSQES